MNISSITGNSQIHPCHNLNKEKNRGSAEYTNFKICILRNELFESLTGACTFRPFDFYLMMKIEN